MPPLTIREKLELAMRRRPVNPPFDRLAGFGDQLDMLASALVDIAEALGVDLDHVPESRETS